MKIPTSPHGRSYDEVLAELGSGPRGLSDDEALARLNALGKNIFPHQPPPTILVIFVRQFLNPLIYVLIGASVVSILLGNFSDAFFIGAVLFVNAVIGTFQERGAERSASALRNMTASLSVVERDGDTKEIPTEDIVLGDIVLLESGRKVPADLRLISTHHLEIDESLLTGESLPVFKEAQAISPTASSLGDRRNMAFKGTIVTQGRGRGVVTATGLRTELGRIADSLISNEGAKPPLLIRMEIFTKRIAVFLLLISIAMGVLLFLRGQGWYDVLLFSVALAVATIPEGLPIALTVALAIASRRMADRNVIVRKLPAVEALGSCTYIATDKTGTLTVNQLTVKKVALPEQETFDVGGSGLNPEAPPLPNSVALNHLAEAGVLCNEAQLGRDANSWVGTGDAVDLALLVLGRKAALNPEDRSRRFRLIGEIPFEPQNQFAATLHQEGEHAVISVKGALERLLPMCSNMMTATGELRTLESERIHRQSDELASAGYRVLALAGRRSADTETPLSNRLSDLVFYGLTGMIDPLRPEAKEAIASCHRAGIEVAMVTGDHPKTSLAIARELGLARNESEVLPGPRLKAASPEERQKWIESARVFARVEPQQKLEIVEHLIHQGRFVAVTGDGANDAPALRAANVGVAMGQSGTDVAKETADLIITDDRFASIVSGIEQGRIAYANIRKVIYLLTATGAAEILIFFLSFVFNTPLPLTAVQILWLNLVTNGIQDKGLAFEPGEGDELSQPPRRPNEPIFDRLMLERIGLSALTMGGVSFLFFNQMLTAGMSLDEARNLTLLLMVLFENVMIGNCRSETKSGLRLNPFKNPVLLVGTLAAQLIHIAAMYTPGLRETLGVAPVPLTEWAKLLGLALSVFVVIEIHKLIYRRWRYPRRSTSGARS